MPTCGQNGPEWFQKRANIWLLEARSGPKQAQICPANLTKGCGIIFSKTIFGRKIGHFGAPVRGETLAALPGCPPTPYCILLRGPTCTFGPFCGVGATKIGGKCKKKGHWGVSSFCWPFRQCARYALPRLSHRHFQPQRTSKYPKEHTSTKRIIKITARAN